MTHDSTGKLRVPSDAALDAAIDRFAQSVIDLGDYAAKAQIATSLEALMRYRTEREKREGRDGAVISTEAKRPSVAKPKPGVFPDCCSYHIHNGCATVTCVDDLKAGLDKCSCKRCAALRGVNQAVGGDDEEDDCSP